MKMKKSEIISLPNQALAAQKGTIPYLVSAVNVPPNVLAFAKNKKFFIKTYGCQANIRDEEVMAGYLVKAGFTKTLDQKEADLAIINTCAVRENAEDKIYGEIGTFKSNFERDHSFKLILAGCVMEENDVAASLFKNYPFISLIIGTHDVSNLLSLLSRNLTTGRSLLDVRSFAGEVVEGLPSLRLSPFKAYVNISYGCDKFCTYCIVPYTRGRERSRKKEEIIKECQSLVNGGYKEITLLGQNVNSYGLDFGDGTNFASLLEEVANLGMPRLRFITSYPSQFTDEMIEVMARHDNIEKWLHFPVQSGSTSCLKRMGRRYTREEYLRQVAAIRKAIPDIALTSDIIVGFPLETEEEFADTLSLCQEARYSSAFTFIYSPRTGTPAAKMPQIPPEISHERFDRLKKVIEETTSEHSLKMVGKTFDVLVDGPSKKDKSVLSGYASNGKLINFPGPDYLTGAIVKVKVLESRTYSLIGELVEDPLIAKARDVQYLMSLDPIIKEYLRLDEKVRQDPSIKELGEKLVAAKKALALSLNDETLYDENKKKYEDLKEEIATNPLLANHDELKPLVEEALLETRDLLRK